MQNINSHGIKHQLTENEFNLLPFLDSRLFVESAQKRFTGWQSPFDKNYLDWKRRILIQHKMCTSLKLALEKNLSSFQEKSDIKILYLGAALGSISSYFSLNVLKQFGFLNKTSIYLYDLLPEPLALTKHGSFEFTEEAAKDCGIGDQFTPAEYKSALSNCEIICGNIVDLPDGMKDFDIVIAPYIHHHLNIYDKEKACQEMQRVLRPGGIAVIGDLFFDYKGFSKWLSYHKVETISYALESFISAETHIKFFKNPEIVNVEKGDIFYNFSLILN